VPIVAMTLRSRHGLHTSEKTSGDDAGISADCSALYGWQLRYKAEEQMPTLSDEFAQAVRNVTIHGEKRASAIAAHTEVRNLREADSDLSEWGIDTILIGSYAR
jgi:hypothetical protein